jgi:hypothetical protein
MVYARLRLISKHKPLQRSDAAEPLLAGTNDIPNPHDDLATVRHANS